MTPAKLVHLQSILAHLDWLLLDIAAKRTQGDWSLQPDHQWIAIVNGDNSRVASVSASGRNYNATYIAACSNNAERAWRSTKVAIKSCIADDPKYQDMYYLANQDLIEYILAEWPLESLKSRPDNKEPHELHDHNIN